MAPAGSCGRRTEPALAAAPGRLVCRKSVRHRRPCAVRLIELLPNFISELQIVCEQLGRPDLTRQLATVELDANSYDADTRVAHLRLRPSRPAASPMDEPTRKETAPANEDLLLRHRYGVRVHTDNVGHLRQMTVAEGVEIAEALGRYSPLRR